MEHINEGCMKAISALLCIVVFFCIATSSFGKNFGESAGNIWADTPAGKFECLSEQGIDSRSHQVLKINGKVIYQGSYDESPNGGEKLSDGIYMGSGLSGNCPDIIENRAGYLIYEIYISGPEMEGAPNAGVMGYGLINFNVMPPTIIPLPDGQSFESNSFNHRFKWDKKGFTMHYYGYPLDVESGTINSPRARSHTIRFDFSSQEVKQIK